jgi:hypothetical protein
MCCHRGLGVYRKRSRCRRFWFLTEEQTPHPRPNPSTQHPAPSTQCSVQRTQHPSSCTVLNAGAGWTVDSIVCYGQWVVGSRLPASGKRKRQVALGTISCAMGPESLELTAPQHTAVKTQRRSKKCHPNFCRRVLGYIGTRHRL